MREKEGEERGMKEGGGRGRGERERESRKGGGQNQ